MNSITFQYKSMLRKQH